MKVLEHLNDTKLQKENFRTWRGPTVRRLNDTEQPLGLGREGPVLTNYTLQVHEDRRLTATQLLDMQENLTAMVTTYHSAQGMVGQFLVQFLTQRYRLLSYSLNVICFQC